MCKFSLILATLNRTAELKLCLDSLISQTYKDFEVIVIDQSDNDLTNELVNNDYYNELDIKYFHVDFRGLSRARNFGLAKAKGQYFCLIDDDAAYDINYLYIANEQLSKSVAKTILSGKIIGNSNLNKKTGNQLKVKDILRSVPSPVTIFPMTAYTEIGGFDDLFGVGAKYGACEETDLIFRCLTDNYEIKYVAEMLVTHPTMNHTFEIENKTTATKLKSYSRGYGALQRKYYKNKEIKGLKYCFFIKIVKKLIKRFLGSKQVRLYAKADLEGIKEGWNEYKGELE